MYLTAQKVEQQKFSLEFANYLLEVGHLIWKLKHKYALAGVNKAGNFIPGWKDSMVKTLTQKTTGSFSREGRVLFYWCEGK